MIFENGWAVWKGAWQSKKANRRSLIVLGRFFEEAVQPEAILGHFRLEDRELALLDDLAQRRDGWYSGREIWPEAGALRKQSLEKLFRGGFLLGRVFSGRIRLSDSGRFILILCRR
jgi:hypothetical protein